MWGYVDISPSIGGILSPRILCLLGVDRRKINMKTIVLGHSIHADAVLSTLTESLFTNSVVQLQNQGRDMPPLTDTNEFERQRGINYPVTAVTSFSGSDVKVNIMIRQPYGFLLWKWSTVLHPIRRSSIISFVLGQHVGANRISQHVSCTNYR